MMQLTCSTTKAVLLCAVEDGSAVLRCPVTHSCPPGLVVDVQPIIPINVQLIELAETFLGASVARYLDIEQAFADPVVAMKTDDPEFTLYLARLSRDSGIVAPAGWPTMPQILRSLSGRMRVPYLRAWQILAGGLQLNTKAVDAAEVAKYFEDDGGG
ncbi:MAG: hypothetical protein FJ146_02010 [Deltaproteobacteria bacterium]|nr:hypothetical protein [Deltaproteobacteria bacterium]